MVKGSDASTWYSDAKSKVDAQPISGYGDEAFFDVTKSIHHGLQGKSVGLDAARRATYAAAQERIITSVGYHATRAPSTHCRREMC